MSSFLWDRNGGGGGGGDRLGGGGDARRKRSSFIQDCWNTMKPTSITQPSGKAASFDDVCAFCMPLIVAHPLETSAYRALPKTTQKVFLCGLPFVEVSSVV